MKASLPRAMIRWRAWWEAMATTKSEAIAPDFVVCCDAQFLRGAAEALAPLGQLVGDLLILLARDGVEDQAKRNGQEERARVDRSDQANTIQRMDGLNKSRGVEAIESEQPACYGTAECNSNP